MIIKTAIQTLEALKNLLIHIDDSQYTYRCQNIENGSIGMHVRHSLELFDCLIIQYPENYVNYDERKRSQTLESQVKAAILKIEELKEKINLTDKELLFKSDSFLNSNILIKTNYYRELLYNIEHCIHHAAIIKVVLKHFPEINVPINFGFAPSTIKYKSQQMKPLSS